jgi:hypothetical protein
VSGTVRNTRHQQHRDQLAHLIWQFRRQRRAGLFSTERSQAFQTNLEIHVVAQQLREIEDGA